MNITKRVPTGLLGGHSSNGRGAVFATELLWYLIAPPAAADAVSCVVRLLLAPTHVPMIACTPLVSSEGSGVHNDRAPEDRNSGAGRA